MGHPTTALLLLLLPAATSASCFSAELAKQENLSNSTPGCAELDWSIFGQQRRLLLAHNGIGAVRPTSQVDPTLEELDLSHNALRRLPDAFLQRARSLRRLLLGHNQLQGLPDVFFASTAALQSLELQDNPLPAVPSSVFHPSLSLLTVPCRCDAVRSVLDACARAANLSCLCAAPNGTFNVSNFHERQCPGGPKVVAAAVGATAAVVAVLVAVAVGVAVRRRRRKAATTTTAGWGKRESAGAHGQPRYISHGAESGPTAATAAAAAPGANVAPEYENVFISPCVGTGTAPAHGGTPGWQQAQYR